ncbi:YnfC family lipoprotein [Erwinia rhapontici]|uniref:YnfC family lipoprotein n=1 Tax=Erwinia rhapontici TaxID=55212 RepID=UPI00143834FC|nr:YnfC family lipoprotein [Erwinia rhapontici]NKG32407.1 YnfC family lipoprotein [Erwinia rhapontici]
MDMMKTTLALLLPALLLTGCKNEEPQGVSTTVKNMSTLFRFEPIPGKLKSTHQTLFDASGEKQHEATARFDQQGCLTDVIVTSLYVINDRKIHSNTSLRRDKDTLVGEENGKPVLMKLDGKCNVVSKTRGNSTLNISYNDRGLISAYSSIQDPLRIDITYDEQGRMVRHNIREGARLISDDKQTFATTEADKRLDGVMLTTYPASTREITTRCEYQQGVPTSCRYKIKTSPGDNVIERQSTLVSEFY